MGSLARQCSGEDGRQLLALSDPWRATPSIRTNLDFGSDSGASIHSGDSRTETHPATDARRGRARAGAALSAAPSSADSKTASIAFGCAHDNQPALILGALRRIRSWHLPSRSSTTELVPSKA